MKFLRYIKKCIREKSTGWSCNACGETKCFAGKIDHNKPYYCPYVADRMYGCNWMRAYGKVKK